MSSLPNKLSFLPVSTASESAPTLDANSKGKTTRLTESSPPVLQTSTNNVEKIHTRRIPTPSETAPIIPDHSYDEHSYQNYVEPSRVNQLEEGTTSCCTFMDRYTNFVTRVRNSMFIYIVLLLFSSLPISATVMGVGFSGDCPKLHFLPMFGAVVGAIEAIFLVVWVYAVFTHQNGAPCSNGQIFVFGMLCFVVTVITAVDAVFVLSLSPSSDPASHEYCNETFYSYAFYKEILTAAVIIFSAMLYLPGNRHVLCCNDCSISSRRTFYISL